MCFFCLQIAIYLFVAHMYGEYETPFATFSAYFWNVLLEYFRSLHCAFLLSASFANCNYQKMLQYFLMWPIK